MGTTLHFLYFNSNMVRLKDAKKAVNEARKNYFNSNMVRLKVAQCRA